MPIIKNAQAVLAEKIEKRFWEKVDRRKENECWLWTGGTNPVGYGRFYIYDSVMHYAHRLSYELAHGDISENMVIMHTCDNPSCVNPNHLQMGTQEENMLDKQKKGRQRYPGHSLPGEKNPAAIIDRNTAQKIKASYPSLSYQKIADKYGVSKSQVYRIVKEESWKS